MTADQVMIAIIFVAACSADDVCPIGTRKQELHDSIPARSSTMRSCLDSNGKQHGPFTVLDETGRKRVVGRFVHGEREGRWRFEDPLIGTTVDHFRNGKRHGTRTTTRPDGKLEMELQYRDGVRHGESRFYGGGLLWSIQHYDRGKPAGTWKDYAADGTLTQQRTYGVGGVLLAIDGRVVPPPPSQIELPDGTILERSTCVRFAEETDDLGGCLGFFESMQTCTDDACRKAVAAAALRNEGLKRTPLSDGAP